MDFFEHQDAARRKTFLLTTYFILAVLFIICGVYLSIVAAWNMAMDSGEGIALWEPTLFIQVAAAVSAIILMGSLYKIIALSKGGEKVAEMLGATQVVPDSRDPDDRKLLNVVEEMAIASGVPVPRVYVLRQENAINALAAGLSTRDAIIAVTDGCLRQLSRDELQGVVAHEFSHILNGDMRLNIRLMGIINGILVIAFIGRMILRSMSSGRSSSSRKKGGGGLPVVVLGLALLVVGYVGVLFGKLIKSAVSRQREFLADASAVRFTRNPGGIAGALKKIAGFESGSRLASAHAEEASHLFFVNGLKASFAAMLSTHPALEERIRRIDPLFSSPSSGKKTGGGGGTDRELPPEMQSFAPGAAVFGGTEQTNGNLSPDGVLSMVGAPRQEHLAHAAKLLSDLPADLSEAARESFGARALVYCLLLDPQETIRRHQLARLQKQADPAVFQLVRKLMPVADTVGAGYRLPLLDMTLPALQHLSADQYRKFREDLDGLVAADEQISLFEYAMQYAVSRHLDPLLSGKKETKVKYHTIDQIQVELTELLSIIAWQGNTAPAMAEKAFQRGLNAFGENTAGMVILPLGKCEDLKLLEVALNRLRHAAPMMKKRVLAACIHCICSDNWITVQEAELIRIVSDSLDCPVPLISVGSLNNITMRDSYDIK